MAEDSKQVLCCGVRTWALVIGWTQSILFAIPLGFSIGMMFLFAYVLMNPNPPPHEEVEPAHLKTAIIVTAVSIVICLVGFMAGIFLIVGVKKRSPGKLKIWIIVEITIIILSVINYGLELSFEVSVISIIELFLIVSICSFFIYVVSMYRREILDAGGAGEVSYSFVLTEN